MGVISRRYASLIFVCSIAFIMIAPLQVIDVYAAVPATMNAPTISSKTDLSVKLAFTAPSSDNTITDYTIQKSTDNSSFSVTPTPPGTALTEEVFQLSADTTYYFKVAAVSSAGTGTYSASVEVKTLGAAAFTDFSGGSQDFEAGKSFGEGTQFTAGQSFSAGTMTFGASQQFGAGTEFAAGQSFSAGTQAFAGTQTFGSGSEFAAGQSFNAGQSFTTGTQTFGAGTEFSTGTEFADSQSFGGAQTFGASTKFGASTTFGAVNTFGENMDFSAGTHTFSAAQEFNNGATFGAGQSFGAGESHDFTKDSMAFGAGTDFGAARTFGEAMTFSGTQNWDDDVHTFGADPVFSGIVDFADSQSFPKLVLALQQDKHLILVKIMTLQVLLWTLQMHQSLVKLEHLVLVLSLPVLHHLIWEALLTYLERALTCHLLRHLLQHKLLQRTCILVIVQTLLVQLRHLKREHTLVTAQLLRLGKNYQQQLFHHLD